MDDYVHNNYGVNVDLDFWRDVFLRLYAEILADKPSGASRIF